MRKARRGFNCEDLYTRERDPNRYKEMEYTIRSLHATKGKHVCFRSCELRDSSYQCWIQASKVDQLDTHIANDHLKLDLQQITLLAHCLVQYQGGTSCDFLKSCACGTLNEMIYRRCETVKQTINDAKLATKQRTC